MKACNRWSSPLYLTSEVPKSPGAMSCRLSARACWRVRPHVLYTALYLVLWRCCCVCAGMTVADKAKLVLGGGDGAQDLPKDIHSFYENYPAYRQSGTRFSSIPSQTVQPTKSLYVGQREMGATDPHDKSVDIIGSDDATTCIVAILRHKGTGAAAVAHFDGHDKAAEGVAALVAALEDLAKPGDPDPSYQLSLVGGVLTSDHLADHIFSAILSEFRNQRVRTELDLACVGEVNTRVRSGVNWPIHYGAAINLKTGEVFPATFSDKSPESTLRYTKVVAGDDHFMNIYDGGQELVKISPFGYRPMSSSTLNKLLSASDEEILILTSTTPEVERPYYAKQYRTALQYIKDHPDPLKTVFTDGKPFYFKRDQQSGKWTPYQES